MATHLIIAVPMITAGIVLFALYYRKINKNFLVPGFVLLAADFVNMLPDMSLG
ncbi:hypothetical protein AAH446_05935 [Erwinia sp. P6884]|uniref:hypothetical protein n=1 Tax=Erwinia sp. P6884 TaxID=3141450 RepID=UPI00318A6893